MNSLYIYLINLYEKCFKKDKLQDLSFAGEEWNPILETITDKSVNLKQLIVRLSNYKDKSSADKLSRIMEEINQSINNTKLSLYIRYGPDKDKLSGIGSLLAINIQNN